MVLYFPKARKGLVAGIPNKVPDWKDKWFYVEGDSWEFKGDESTKDRLRTVPRSWQEYNDTITQRTTQAKFADQVKAVLAVHERDRHYLTLLTKKNLGWYLYGLGNVAPPFSRSPEFPHRQSLYEEGFCELVDSQQVGLYCDLF